MASTHRANTPLASNLREQQLAHDSKSVRKCTPIGPGNNTSALRAAIRRRSFSSAVTDGGGSVAAVVANTANPIPDGAVKSTSWYTTTRTAGATAAAKTPEEPGASAAACGA